MSGFRQRASGGHAGHLIFKPAQTAGGPTVPFLIMMAGIVSTWLALIVGLALDGTFHAPPTSPPIATLLGIAVPPLVFVVAMQVSPGFRRNILSIDPVWLAGIHGLRIVGAGFLFVYAFGHLPAIFALVAGWGDVLVALLAPLIAAKLARTPEFLRSNWLRGFHVLGLLDFVGAVGAGLVARQAVEAGAVGTAALGELPLVLIPGFAVPLWICLHIAALIQSGTGTSHSQNEA